jgi:hypothetical protein
MVAEVIVPPDIVPSFVMVSPDGIVAPEIVPPVMVGLENVPPSCAPVVSAVLLEKTISEAFQFRADVPSCPRVIVRLDPDIPVT